MKIESVDIKNINPAKYNPRTINHYEFSGLCESLKKFGLTQPLIINKKTNVLISGHQRLKAAEAIGLSKVPVTYVELSDSEEKAMNITMNNKNISGEFTEGLQELLEEIKNDLDDDYIFDLNLDAVLKDLPKISLEESEQEEPEEAPEEENEQEEKTPGILAEHFVVPPFSVLDARVGTWQERKKYWRELIKDRGQARSTAKCLPEKGVAGINIGDTGGVSLLDPVLAEVILKWYTPHTNSTVFDCFAGDTVFGWLAKDLGHVFTGIELRQEQVDYNNLLCPDSYICDDAINVRQHIKPKSQDLFFSCPPYFDLEVYSDLDNDASNQDSYEDFYAILDKAFKESIECLDDDRFAVVVCGDVRDKKTGAYYNFPDSIKRTFKEAGLSLYNELVLLDPIGSACMRARRYMKSRKVAKVHQNVLVFFKGDTNKIKDLYPILQGEENGSEDAEFSDMD